MLVDSWPGLWADHGPGPDAARLWRVQGEGGRRVSAEAGGGAMSRPSQAVQGPGMQEPSNGRAGAGQGPG